MLSRLDRSPMPVVGLGDVDPLLSEVVSGGLAGFAIEAPAHIDPVKSIAVGVGANPISEPRIVNMYLVGTDGGPLYSGGEQGGLLLTEVTGNVHGLAEVACAGRGIKPGERLRTSRSLAWLMRFDRTWDRLMEPAVLEARIAPSAVVITSPKTWLRIRQASASRGAELTVMQYHLPQK